LTWISRARWWIATVVAIRSAPLEHLVIVFGDQRLTPAQHSAFARRFGPLHSFAYTAARALEGHPETLRVVNEKEDRDVFGELWHADVIFLEKPVLGSIRHAIETPQQGGDTLLANMYLAYETLSDGMKALLEFQFQHRTQPDFVTRLHWAPDTVTIWDNRCTQHRPSTTITASRARCIG
jgi:alpha-ketoglutarate-dependent taurine dioxygenase